ncbi:type II secretion system protein GspH [bacterium E08(2017)]|nr:type II secretion system protein GspH [bacterium E08(2017)]
MTSQVIRTKKIAMPNFELRTSNFRKGFTLVEVLLVLVIVGIVSAVVLPNLAQSLKGNRLRVATRTVVKAGRYARSIAVLKQKPITLTFQLKDSTLTVGGGDEKDNITRKLERINIQSVNIGSDENSGDGNVNVVYQTNGRCEPYELVLVDEEGRSTKIVVDALATAETDSYE